MVKLIEIMLKENLITKDAISTLVKSRPPKKISFANLLAEKMIDLHTVEIFLAKKIRQGVITLSHLEKIEGINIIPIIIKPILYLNLKAVISSSPGCLWTLTPIAERGLAKSH